MNSRRLLYVALLVTTSLWGGSFVAIKHALHYVTPMQLVLLRFVPASMAFVLLLYSRHRLILGPLIRSQWRALCGMALFGVIIYHLALNTGEQSVSAGTASLIMALNPAFIFLLSVVSGRESFSRSKLAGLTIAFVGLFIVVRFASGGELTYGYLRGVLVTLLAPLSWALYTLLGRPLVAKHPPLAVTGLATILGTLPLLGLVQPSWMQAITAMHWNGWASVAFLVIFCTVFGVTIWVIALQHLPASEVGAFIYLVPLWSAILSRVFLREPLTPSLLLGAAVVIGGVIMVNRS